MGVNSRFNPKEATSKYSSIFTRHHTNFLIYHTNTEGMTLGKQNHYCIICNRMADITTGSLKLTLSSQRKYISFHIVKNVTEVVHSHSLHYCVPNSLKLSCSYVKTQCQEYFRAALTTLFRVMIWQAQCKTST